MTDRDLIRIARINLTGPEFDVWLTKHIHGKGRRAGSLALGITEETFRHRYAQATRKITAALARTENAA